MTTPALAHLRLKPKQEQRLKSGHVWIYSNEIDVSRTPLSSFTVGEQVIVESARGEVLGIAYINPKLLLCARLISRSVNSPINTDFIKERIQAALALRERYFALPYYRLIYAESDQLPGVVVDRYGDYLVVQITTAGMECLQETLISALVDVLQPKGILLKNDTSSRLLEGLTQFVEVASGDVPDELTVIENGCHFIVTPRMGQKTGWFYDQRENRAWVQKICQQKQVLDLCSYVGSFAVSAAMAGAAAIYAVDSSTQALASVKRNAHLNQVAERVHVLSGDIFDVMKELSAQNKKFDLVLLDPPAFIKKRKDLNQGSRAYERLNKLAMQLVNPDGVLVSSSCSWHYSRDMLTDALLKASVHWNRPLQIIHQGHQALDHPVHPAIPETDYLKTICCALR